MRISVQITLLALALIRVILTFFRQSATRAEIALRLVFPEDLSRVLLDDTGSPAAGMEFA